MHLSKTFPCDFQCGKCDFQGENRNGYYYHMRAKHPDKTLKKVTESPQVNELPQVDELPQVNESPQVEQIPVETYQPARRGRVRLPGDPIDTKIIPIHDFDPQCLKELAALANKEDVEIVFERVTIKPLRRRRAEEAVKHMLTSDYAQSLQCLDRDIVSVAAEILSRFHGDPRRPQLHAIRMGDISRKMVNIHCRPVAEHDSKWLSFAKEPTLTTLSGHTSTILTYMLERASDMLRYKFCTKEKVVCFSLHDAQQSKNIIVVDDTDFSGAEDGDMLVLLGYQPRLKVMFYDGELTDIVQGFGYTEKARELGLLINQKTEEVLQQLKTLTFREQDIISFLERTRRPLVE